MENLNDLWEYQKRDIELDTFKKQLKNTPTRKRLLKLQRYLKNSRKKLNTIENKIVLKQSEVYELERQYTTLLEDVDDLNKDISYYSECDVQGLKKEEVEEFVAKGKKLYGVSSQIRKDMAALREEIDVTDKLLKELLQKMRAAKKEYDTLKVKHTEELNSVAGEVKDLKARVAEVEKKLSPALLKEYKRVKEIRPTPVAILQDNRCAGCNMLLPSGMAASVKKAEKLTFCENCGRILIVLE